MTVTFLGLPNDILILVLQGLLLTELSALSQTCQLLHDLVNEYGWHAHLRANPRPSFSLLKARDLWTARARLRYDTVADRAWSQPTFVARPLARPWTWAGKLQPTLAINSSRLAVAAGGIIYLYTFGESRGDGAPPIELEGSFSLHATHQSRNDVTAMSFLDDGGLDCTLLVGFHDGTLKHISLVPVSKSDKPTYTVNNFSSSVSNLHIGDTIERLSSEDNFILSQSSSGSVVLTNWSTPSSPPSAIQLPRRSWTSHLSMRSSTPYAAVGSSSSNPLTVHLITDDGLSKTPSAILSPGEAGGAVYGISRAPISSPWGSSPQLIVAGWFDGQVRCYDLRSSSRISSDESGNPAPLRPVLSLADPFSYEPIYSVSCGGGASSHIAAGCARHSVVSFWDIRSPVKGWSVHAPGNDPSPVYDVILESSRLFGATQSRPFVYDFGPGVTADTYPRLPDTPGVDGLKPRKGSRGVGYYVTKYSHNRANSSHVF